MGSSLYLLLSPDEPRPFDSPPVIRGLKDCPYSRNWTIYSERHTFHCEFDYQDDSTIIWMPIDCACIYIQGTGIASFKAAMVVQEVYDDPIYIYNDEFTHNVIIADAKDPAELDDLVFPGFGESD